MGLTILCHQAPWGLSLSVEDVTPTGLTILCHQADGKPSGRLQTGSYFVVERRTETGWAECPLLVENLAWTEEAYTIPYYRTTPFEKDWTHIYGSLPGGTYRIGIWVYDFRGAGDFDKKMYYAEFEL